MALSTSLGKCVNGGVSPILVLGFELLQLSRLHSHCTDEETETQTMESSCLRPPGTEPGYSASWSGAFFPLHPLSPLPVWV